MAVIELGLVGAEGDEQDARPDRRPLGRRDLRSLLVAVVTAVSVLTVTGSARPDPSGLTELWSIPFELGSGAYMLTPDTVYVLTQPGQDRLSAYDLRTGGLRWSRPAPDDSSWLSGIRAGALLLPAGLSTAMYEDADGSTVTRELSRDTVAVDAGTGRLLWRQTGELINAEDDRALLSEWNEAGDKITTFRAVRLSDGSTIWSRPAGDIGSWATDNAPGAKAERLVTVTAQGRAEVLDLDDGSLVTTGTFPWRPESASENDYTTVTVDGAQLYLERNEGDASTVTAYDTDTLRQLWRVDRTAPGGAYGCGPVVCLNGTNDTTGRDRTTGEVRWRIPGAANGFPLLDGLLLVGDDETGARHRLVDTATGRQLIDLGTAMPVWDHRLRGTRYVVARAQNATNLTLISQMDPRSGQVLLRGTVAAVLDFGCQSSGDVIVCETGDNRLIVTDVG
ncbi:outer membrane protein assembly factor BamB family protein [Actinoplanes sp. NPDC004185]